MSERDIRAALRKVCEELDLRARLPRVQRSAAAGVRGAVLPMVLGAGLAATACNGDVETTGSGGSGTGQTNTGAYAGAQPAYMAPGGWGGTGGEAGAAQPLYAAPGGAGGVGGAGGGGVAGDPGLEYMAPDPDAGPEPDYMAP